MADRSIAVKLRAEVGQYKKGMEEAARSTEKVSKKADAAQGPIGRLSASIEKNADAWHTAGLAIAGTGAAMALGLGFAAKAAIDWESAWAGVTKTVSGTPEQMAALEKELRGLTAILPATHDEIAGVAEAAGQLGVARKDIASFTKTMIDLGETTNLTADEAATSIAQFMNVMGTAPEEVDNLGAALVALGNDGASTERDIIQMAQRIAGAATTVGLAESDVLALANAVASMGINVEAGGTSVSRVLTEMAKAAATGGKELEAFARTAGMTAEEFSRSFTEEPTEAFTAFIGGLERTQEAGGNLFGILEEIGLSDIRVSQALIGMASSGDLLTDSLKLGADAWEDNTALAEEAAKRYDTTAAKMQITRNQIHDALISIGEGFLPVINGVLGGVSNLLQGFNGLGDGAKTTITVIAALGTAVALAGGAMVLAIPKLLAFSAAVDSMAKGPVKSAGKGLIGMGKILMGPWGLALAGATVALGIWAKSSADAAAKQRELEAEAKAFADSLDDSTGAITAQTRELVINKLAQDGVLAAAKEYGISLGLITEASLGNADAARELGSELEVIGEQLGSDVATDAGEDFRILAESFGTSVEAAKLGKEQWTLTGEATKAMGDAASKAGDGITKLAERAAESQAEMDKIRNKAQEVAGSFFDLTKDINNTDVTLSEWIDGLAAQAEAARNFTENLRLAGKRDIDEGLIRSFRQLGEQGAMRLDQLANASDAEIARANEAFRKGQDAAQDLTGTLVDLGNTKAEPEVNVETGTSSRRVRGLQEQIDSMQSRTVTITTIHRQLFNTDYGSYGNGLGVVREAKGSILDFYADGGFSENHIAQIAPAGANRFWAEPETGGEAYIPLSPAKRARSTDIWEETGKRLGIEGFADGGIAARYAAPQRLMPVQHFANGGIASTSKSNTQVAPSISPADLRAALEGMTFAITDNGVMANEFVGVLHDRQARMVG